jgi:hypothetical protein
VNLSAVALVALVAASVLTPTAFVLFDNVQSQMAQLNSQESTVVNGTIGFLDHAWDVAQEFQNSSYHYDPAEFDNYTNASP